MGRLIHKIKNPMNNETWEAVGHQTPINQSIFVCTDRK
jgi:hypothetical protein